MLWRVDVVEGEVEHATASQGGMASPQVNLDL